MRRTVIAPVFVDLHHIDFDALVNTKGHGVSQQLLCKDNDSAAARHLSLGIDTHRMRRAIPNIHIKKSVRLDIQHIGTRTRTRAARV